jgi:sarcosine oxidase
MNPDVVVIGLGGMGSAAAYHLASRGQRVLGLEQFTPAHDRGSSHGDSRITRQSYLEDPRYVPLLLHAHDLWERLAADSGRDVIRLVGGIYLGGPGSGTFGGALRAAQEWSLPHEVLDAAQVRRKFPTLRPAGGMLGLHESRAGYVRPEETVTAHLELAAAAGADLRFTEPATGWTALPGGDGVRVISARGAYEAARLVICPGAWAPSLLAGLGVPLDVERQVMYWFAPASVAAFEDHPVYFWEDDEGVQLYGFPAIDGPGGGVKTAFHHHGGTACTPDTIDRTVHDAEAAAIRRFLRPRMPSLPGDLLRAVTCMYTNTPDHHFAVGPHPDFPHVAVACGFSGHGFKFVPVIGEILADLAIEGTTRHPIGLFDPRRFRPEF